MEIKSQYINIISKNNQVMLVNNNGLFLTKGSTLCAYIY